MLLFYDGNCALCNKKMQHLKLADCDADPNKKRVSYENGYFVWGK